MHVSIAVGIVVVYLAFLEIWLIRVSRTVKGHVDA
jgi:hypothetical protein